MGSVGANINSSIPAWRLEEPRYQRQTTGGVYFWSGPRFFDHDIDEKMYDRLPKKMQAAVVALDNSKTADGNHASIYFINSAGRIDYFDEYGLGDFYAGVRAIKDVGNAADWQYDGSYKIGQQLKRRR